MAQTTEKTSWESCYWFSNSKDQCSLLSYFKHVILAKDKSLTQAAAVVCNSVVHQTLSYQLKVVELKLQEKRMQNYLETLSKLILSRHQLGKVAVHK
jgi:hypothetical protein